MIVKKKIYQEINNKIHKINPFFRSMTGVLAGLMIVGGITHLLNQMYVNVGADTWERILWHHFYEDEGKLDNLCMGSSHVYCGINPQILDRLSGQYNFNLSGPEQPLNASYYLLREADNRNELSHVYLDMYYVCTVNEGKLLQYNKNWQNTDYMRPSVNKAAYMLSIGEQKQYVNILFPFSRYRKHLGDWDYIEGCLQDKKQTAYRNYQYECEDNDGNGWDRVEKQGYWRSTMIYEDRNKLFRQRTTLSECHIGDENREYFHKISAYCHKKGISVTLFVTPIHDLQLISTLDYDDYVTEARALAAECKVPFYDFNLAKKEYLPLQESTDYRDEGHLNQYGAEVFTPFFYQIVTGEQTSNKKYFYDSYEEKLRNLPPKIYGIYYMEPTEEKPLKTMCVASNRDDGMEYRIILTPEEWEEKEQYIVQDFNENKVFEVPPEERGICRIEARMKGAPDKVQIMEINY